MAALIVAYDLHKLGQNYEGIKKVLEGYPSHWHMQGSVWIIQTTQTPIQVRDALKGCLDPNDDLFVGQLTAGAWTGYDEAATKWLKAVIEAPAHS